MEFPVIDSHHHVWMKKDLDWLNGELQPRIFGDYTDIKKDYSIEEYIDDVIPYDVVKSVYIQCNWPEDKCEEEALYIDECFNASGWPSAFIGFCDLLNPKANNMLEKLLAYPLTRGIRMQLHWHKNKDYSFASRDNIMEDKIFNKNLEFLAKNQLVFELQIFENQVDQAIALANRFPEINFILQHAGMPHDDTKDGIEKWLNFMKKLAPISNIYIKLSGLGTFIHKNDTSHIKFIVESVLSIFSSNRCLFGSNFPIEKIWCNYGELINSYKDATKDLKLIDKKNIFYNTAKKLYRLG
ncbi:MAG: amidohydrolase family protein [Rhodobiaceae bacterium]|nr:amidohydrolase family protein [Rhodobiaceae bacterium]